jgi:excisionase family DNA binding protein
VNGPLLVDATEAARLLGVKVGWLREQVRAGRIPCVRFDGSRLYRFQVADLERFVDEHVDGGEPR